MPPPTLKDLETVFTNVVSALFAFGALVLFVMMISTGLKYLNSGGDPKSVEGAQKTFTYAVGGFVILAGSYLILKIIESFTGVTVGTLTNFTITK